MGIRLMDGRFFDERDTHEAPDVAIVNKTMATTFWPDQSVIGRRIRPGFSDPWCTIVGVVDDVKNAGLDRPTGTELYLPYLQEQAAGASDMYVVMRAQADDQRSLASVVHDQLNEIDPSLPLADVRLMEDVLSRAQSRPRFLTLLLSLFSGVALAIATVGIYGVVSYSVARRTKEFGLRMVLGAQGGDVLGLVMKQGAGMVAIGIVAGLATAFALTRLMASLLFGVTATDLCAVWSGAGGLLRTCAACDSGGSHTDLALRVAPHSNDRQSRKNACCRRRWLNLVCHLSALQFSLARHPPTRPAPDARSLDRADSDRSAILRMAGLRWPHVRRHAHGFRAFLSGDAAFCRARRRG